MTTPSVLPKHLPWVLHDISVAIHPEMVTFPGDPGVNFKTALAIDDGDCANVTTIQLGSQTGTHFDTPHHILNNREAVEQLPLTACYGPALVVEFTPNTDIITESDLQQVDLMGAERVLFKTRNSQYWESKSNQFQSDYVGLSPGGADYLVAQGVQLVGIDYLSIEPYQSEGLPTHHVLLEANVIILEGLNLSAIRPGFYLLSAFPVCFQRLDGALTRAVLIETLL